MQEWFTMEELVDQDLLSFEIAKDLLWVCSHCQNVILVNRNLTKVRDANFYCPMYLGQRGAELFKALGYRDVAEKTLQRVARTKGVTNHFEFLNKELYPPGTLLYDYASRERSMPLTKIAELAAIPGVKTSAFASFAKYGSMEEYFEQDPYSSLLWARELFRSAEKYIKIEPPLMGQPVTIIITGNLAGGESKDHYVARLNNEFGFLYAFDRINHWKNSVDFVVADVPSTNSKYVKARQMNIPIYTAQELWDKLESYKKKVLSHIQLERGERHC